jgi:hypothetical protein
MANSLKIGLPAALVLLVVAVSAPRLAIAASSTRSSTLGNGQAQLVAAPTGPSDTLLTFSEFPVGTVITNQYAADGVVFSALTGNAPIIANDSDMPNSPVLSPNPPFAGDFQWTFPGGAVDVQFDSGFWDILGTGVIDVFGTSNNLLAALTSTSLDGDHVDLTSLGVIGRVTFDSSADPAGADIDNLQFVAAVPEPMSLVLLGTGLVAFRLIRRRKAA